LCFLKKNRRAFSDSCFDKRRNQKEWAGREPGERREEKRRDGLEEVGWRDRQEDLSTICRDEHEQ
jgi:hypothetical protein